MLNTLWQSQGVKLVDEEAGGSENVLTCSLVTTNIHKWWSTFVIVVGDSLSATAVVPSPPPEIGGVFEDQLDPAGDALNIGFSASDGHQQPAATASTSPATSDPVRADRGDLSHLEPEPEAELSLQIGAGLETAGMLSKNAAIETQIVNRRANRKAVDIPALLVNGSRGQRCPFCRDLFRFRKECTGTHSSKMESVPEKTV